MSEPATAPDLLPLLRLASSALPVGSFTGSEALEYAVAAGWVHDEVSARDWIGGRMRHSLSTLDVALLRRFQAAGRVGAQDPLERWSAYLRASRESSELREHDNAMGRALARLLLSLGCARARPWTQHADASYACSFALAAHHWGIAPEPAATRYVIAWCESQVAAVVKLVPLGQTAGQRLIGALIKDIPRCVSDGLALEDAEVGASEPGLAIASALHETQYARLFRS